VWTRSGEQPPAPLPERRLLDEAEGRAKRLVVPPAAQDRLGVQVLAVPAKLEQALGLDPARSPLDELGERLTPPEPHRLPQQAGRALGLAQPQQFAGALEEVLEVEVVEVVHVQHEAVALRRGLDGPGAEGLAQADDAALDHLGPGRRRGFPPEGLGQGLGADRRARAHSERLEDDAVAQAERRDRPVNLEGAEHTNAHALKADLSGPPVNHRDTEAIPLRHCSGTGSCDNSRGHSVRPSQNSPKGSIDMAHHSTFRRGASALGASALIALSLAGPASARPDPGTGGLHEWPQWSEPYVGGTGSTGPAANIDSNVPEYLQLGAGVLAGIALAGAGLAVASRRSHAHAAHPA
jgi:hypothetical protein